MVNPVFVLVLGDVEVSCTFEMTAVTWSHPLAS